MLSTVRMLFYGDLIKGCYMFRISDNFRVFEERIFRILRGVRPTEHENSTWKRSNIITIALQNYALLCQLLVRQKDLFINSQI